MNLKRSKKENEKQKSYVTPRVGPEHNRDLSRSFPIQYHIPYHASFLCCVGCFALVEHTLLSSQLHLFLSVYARLPADYLGQDCYPRSIASYQIQCGAEVGYFGSVLSLLFARNA